jgi:ApaG protein
MSNAQTFEETTEGVRILVTPVYLSDQSDPADGRHVWAYQVRIENQSATQVQLLTRRWRITDGNGAVHEVIGDGVVGDQPVLAPGDGYEYSSGTPLSTSSGFMTGIFQMVDADGRRFAAKVPAFSLDGPGARNAVH